MSNMVVLHANYIILSFILSTLSIFNDGFNAHGMVFTYLPKILNYEP